jgi:hypothetical protein
MHLLSTDHKLVPAERKRPYCSAEGVHSLQVDGRLPIGQRQEDVVIHSLTANIGEGKFNHKHCNNLVNFFL